MCAVIEMSAHLPIKIGKHLSVIEMSDYSWSKVNKHCKTLPSLVRTSRCSTTRDKDPADDFDAA